MGPHAHFSSSALTGAQSNQLNGSDLQHKHLCKQALSLKPYCPHPSSGDVTLVLPSHWQKAHELLTIPNTAGRKLLEQMSLSSPRVWPHTHHPARRVLQCPSAQQRNTQGQKAKIVSFQRRKIVLQALVTFQLIISICLTLLCKHRSYLTSQLPSPLLKMGQTLHPNPLPHLGPSPESSSARRSLVALPAPRYHPDHVPGKAQRWLWLLVNPDRHLFDSCAGLSWQAGTRGQPGKESF